MERSQIIKIYLKYTLISLIIVACFFTLQFTLVVKEMKPQYIILPIVLGLVIGSLVSTIMLFRERLRLEKNLLAGANAEIIRLNEQLNTENLRMGAELDVTRKLQQMLLPKERELQKIVELDIAGFMEPAAEVGGDYFDVLQQNGRIKIGIGDVTGHGLESGVLMLMVQMAVRTLLANNVCDPETFLDVLNRAVFANVQRMDSDKNLTLALLDYEAGVLRLTGQHEEVLLVRKDGSLERVDTLELGFAVGLKEDISDWLQHYEFKLEPGDGIVLYTDGITEAMNIESDAYSIERLCDKVREHWQDSSALEVQRAIISDVLGFVGDEELLDDVTLLVIKQR